MPQPDKEYTLKPEPKSAVDTAIENKGVPIYMERLELSEEQKERLVKELTDELDVINEQREAEDLENKWQTLDNQYNGELDDDSGRQFNLNKNVTKVKIDKIVKLSKQAFFETDPVFSVSPRPGFYKQNGLEVCVKQQDFLDYKMDNLPFDNEIDLVFHSAANKGTGILKIFHDIRIEKRRREEYYKAEIVPVIDPNTKQPAMGPDGMPIIRNKGLEEFISNWPNALKDYPAMVKKLMEGKDINFIAEYNETTYNDPRPKSVDLKDFYCRTNTDGYEGLEETRLIAERKSYTYWELKKEEKQDKFYDIDKLVYDEKKKEKTNNYENKQFDILECVYYFKLKETDEEETRCVFWMDEEKEIIIGSILYPYYAISSYYIPFYIKKKNSGFYQPGVAEDLTDSNLAENAILNLTLEGAYINNTVTPITSSDDVNAQFLEKRFAHGVPIMAKQGEVDFLQKYMRPTDINGLVMLLQYLVQGDDDISGISSLMSGRETAFDPDAPAAKTMALLKQSGIDVKDYINHLSKSFNEVGYILLAIYYQMSREGKKYAPRPENIVGDNPFQTLERNEMIARTNIQARAYTYDPDKIQENAKDVALYQLIRQEPLIAKSPEAVYTLLKNIIEGWSVKYRNIAQKIIPSLSDFKKMQIQAAVQGVGMYVQAVVEKAKTAGIPPEFDPNQLLQVVADLSAQLVSPPAEVVQKAQARKEAEAVNA